jgi:DNA-binding response OmpR family regulator
MAACGTILLVDDDPSFVDAAALLLEDRGYRVRRAYSGEEAIHRAGEGGIDLAVIDVHLPDIEGPDVARQVSNGRVAPALIMISGDDSRGTIGRCLRTNPCIFLPKPLAPQEFLGVVARLLRSRQTTTARHE